MSARTSWTSGSPGGGGWEQVVGTSMETDGVDVGTLVVGIVVVFESLERFLGGLAVSGDWEGPAAVVEFDDEEFSM